ncbi:MAG: hypothetical protein IH909_00005 [Proteobacteria bacterium]|nr:hypothetical protein [Pseudomonadota bacterium]
MPNCIYCQEDRPEQLFQRREHVIPQSFGVFRNNFTLLAIVCDPCNQYFGDVLEIVLARDSFEGQSRFIHGVRNPEEFRPFGRNSRLIIRIGEGDFKGAYAYREYSQETDDIVLQLLPQIGFLMAPSGRYEYYLLDEIPSEQDLHQRGFDSGYPDAIRGLVIDEAQLQGKLAEIGINFKYGGEIVPHQDSHTILCELEGTIDQKIIRTIAKIAFNYLAYWQGPELLQEPSFDTARSFIRYGEQPGYRMVDIREEAILADEPVVGQRQLGHLITINFAQDRVSIMAQVSLFNWVTYCVSLAREYQGERRDIRRGHFFDVANQEILELGVQ